LRVEVEKCREHVTLGPSTFVVRLEEAYVAAVRNLEGMPEAPSLVQCTRLQDLQDLQDLPIDLPVDLPRAPNGPREYPESQAVPSCPKLSQAVPSCPKLSTCRKLSEMRIHSLQYFWTFDD